MTNPEQDVEVGTTFVDKTPLGRFHGRVTEFDPPHRVAFQQQLRRWGKLVFVSKPSYTLEPTEDGTHVRHAAKGEAYGPTRFTEPLVRWLAANERRSTIDTLKESLES